MAEASPGSRGAAHPPKGGTDEAAATEPSPASYHVNVAQLRRPSGSIVGRAGDVRGVRNALEHGRLVNLVGPGGVGKTALAAEIINEVDADFDRMVPVELAEAAHRADILRLLSVAVLDAATADIDRIVEALSASPTFLVLDNCEHLIDDVVELVTAILGGTDDVSILATSRRPLAVTDEFVWPLRPLVVASGYGSDEELTSAGATQLFLERVRQSVPTFELTESNRAMVAKICAAADGVPLVLELAAALVRGRPLDLILEAMSERPAGLNTDRRDRPDHQRSLAASLDWSRRFLAEADALLLDRLSVFVGGFTATAARHVDPEGTADGLSRLVDHSLITFDPQHERYRILEVVRLDARGRLDPLDLERAVEAHFNACLELVDKLASTRFEADPDNVFPRFEHELANLGAALRRCYEQGDVDRFRSLLGPIALWLVHYMAPQDPSIWEDMFADPESPIEWRAQVQSALSFYWSHRGQHQRALEHGQLAIELFDKTDEANGHAVALIAASNAHLALGDRDSSFVLSEQALARAQRSNQVYGELGARVNLARLAPGTDEAFVHLTTAQSKAAGFGAMEALIAAELGQHALGAGRVADARRISEEALAMARRFHYAESLATALCIRGDVAVAEGDSATAAELYEEALTLGRQSVHAGVVERASTSLEKLPTVPKPAPGGSADGVDLSDRELAVARLLRGDMTQREIADELYIAPSTVKTHVKSIYRKLGVTKRSYAVTRAGELGLFDVR